VPLQHLGLNCKLQPFRPKHCRGTGTVMTECRRFHKGIQIFKSVTTLQITITFSFTLRIIHNVMYITQANFGKRSFFYSGVDLWNLLQRVMTEVTGGHLPLCIIT